MLKRIKFFRAGLDNPPKWFLKFLKEENSSRRLDEEDAKKGILVRKLTEEEKEYPYNDGILFYVNVFFKPDIKQDIQEYVTFRVVSGDYILFLTRTKELLVMPSFYFNKLFELQLPSSSIFAFRNVLKFFWRKGKCFFQKVRKINTKTN